MEREREEREGKEVSTWYSTYICIYHHACMYYIAHCMYVLCTVYNIH